MDQTGKLNRYRSILQKVLETHADMPGEPEETKSFAVCDVARDHYLLLDVEEESRARNHYIVCHLRLIDGKVLIEHDGIEYGIAEDLIEAGIPEEDIVFAYGDHKPKVLTELVAA